MKFIIFKKYQLYTYFLCIFNVFYAEQKNFVIIVPSYNNVHWCQKNLDSIFTQNYQNYHVIYIDDHSNDGTEDYVEQYIRQHNLFNKVTFIKNSYRRGALSNYYDTIHSCNDSDIIVTVDGDDWLAHNHVLSFLNEIYQDKNIWLTYGQFRYYPRNPYDAVQAMCGDIGLADKFPDEIIKNRDFRKYGPYVATHLRTFYAYLFKKIKKEDLMHNEDFYWVSWDAAFMFPMLEMCGNRFKAVSDILYFYNCENPLNDWRIQDKLQNDLANEIRSKNKYNLL